MSRFMRVERYEVVTSRQRQPEEGIVPPFSFPGELDISISGTWPPRHRPVEIVSGKITATQPGTQDAGFVVLRREKTFTNEFASYSLRGVVLPADALELEFSMKTMEPAVINPQQELYVASFVASGHTNVVVTFKAVYLDR